VAEPRSGQRQLRYVPVGLLAGWRHVIVDGAPRGGTVCTLSHWPGTPTPEELWHDVSAGIVLRALERAAPWPDDVEAASVDHYDADGVIALALLCVEGLAADHGTLLVEAARVGDFGVVTDRRAALVAFGIETLGDVERAAPLLGVAVPDGGVMERTAWAATEALRVLPGLVADPERHRALWVEEADAFDASGRALVEGWASIEERPQHDLAIVRVDVTHPDAVSVLWSGTPLHRAAVHSATERLRVATIAGGRVEVRYRYESWVRLISRRPRPRVDLAPVAAELTRTETAGARWVFDGAGAITGALHLAEGGASTLDPEHVVDVVCARLDTLDAGTAAWDPYAVPIRAG
jgi:hypothetical protein